MTKARATLRRHEDRQLIEQVRHLKHLWGVLAQIEVLTLEPKDTKFATGEDIDFMLELKLSVMAFVNFEIITQCNAASDTITWLLISSEAIFSGKGYNLVIIY